MRFGSDERIDHRALTEDIGSNDHYLDRPFDRRGIFPRKHRPGRLNHKVNRAMRVIFARYVSAFARFRISGSSFFDVIDLPSLDDRLGMNVPRRCDDRPCWKLTVKRNRLRSSRLSGRDVGGPNGVDEIPHQREIGGGGEKTGLSCNGRHGAGQSANGDARCCVMGQRRKIC